MKRRNFIKSSILASSTAGLLPTSLRAKSIKGGVEEVSGFIFSDAHIGWRGKDQPSIDEQSKAIQVIKSRFNHLDLVFDTGDIHHGYLNEEERNVARNVWLSKMANQFSTSLFHYIPGNHELGKGPRDTELTAAKIGSMNFRPYYSFDYKGIHFVSLPQLTDTILINIESLKWLEHDLSLNKNKTTLIFSHNSIKGTTFDNNENGYRVVINSKEVLKILDKHSNVLGWFHGHNHQYEVVKKVGRLYVSNGRIGGFNPPNKWGPFGQGHLGGVYFTVNSKGLSVRCFSAKENKFFDEFGFMNLSNKIIKPTSFDPNGKCNYYYGHGQISDNIEYKLRNHYLSEKPTKIFTHKNDETVINDNHTFDLTTELFFIGKRTKRLVGYQLLPREIKRDSIASGLFLNQSNSKQNHMMVQFPNHKFTKHNFMARGSYFRTEVGDTYLIKAQFELSEEELNSAKGSIQYVIYNETQEELFKSELIVPENQNNGLFEFSLIIPEFQSPSKNSKYIKFSLRLDGFPQKFVANSIAVSKKVDSNKKMVLSVNNNDVQISEDKHSILPGNNKHRSDLLFRGAQSSIIFKVENVDWQVRNATAEYTKNKIKLLSYCHDFQNSKEVLLTPTKDVNFYVNKTINLMPVEIQNKKNQIIVNMKSFASDSLIAVKISKQVMSGITGGRYIGLFDGLIHIKPEAKVVEITLKE
ncbi:metallophosphoesterase family protein [Marinicella rhabdoformis]|uniref:metallophosphoesterase family protein n=1 Tax=Marinicella rhabdoformis TaxID=2580566 RepID=UPI0012AEBAE5|nr:hypothetical protein [Marinicella rhabdoformis]